MTQRVNANIRLDEDADAALTTVSSALHVSRSDYVSAVLRAKFGLSCGDLITRHVSGEGMAVPPELAGFKYVRKISDGRRKPGPKPRIQKIEGNVAVGNNGTLIQSITHAAPRRKS